MADEPQKEIKPKDKQEITSAVEQTKPGPVFSPDIDIYETDKAITLIADLPGVGPDHLTIDLKEDTLILIGEAALQGGPDEEDLLKEYETGRFHRQFTLAEVIDQDKIEANLKDGVLKLVLPKIEKKVPKKITVHAG